MRRHQETEQALCKRRQQFDLLFHRLQNWGPSDDIGCPCEHEPGRFRKRRPFGCSCHVCRHYRELERLRLRRLRRREEKEAIHEQLEEHDAKRT